MLNINKKSDCEYAKKLSHCSLASLISGVLKFIVRNKVFIGLCLVITIWIILSRSHDYLIQPRLCVNSPEGIKKLVTADIEGSNNIFFLETSCYGDKYPNLTLRQACAVESAARMNPTMNVYLLILSNSKCSRMKQKKTDILINYTNIVIGQIFMEEYVKNTPLEEWWNADILKTSNWPIAHMSDILRYLTLWKFGGIYLDLDVVITTSLEKLTDFAGAESSKDVGSSVLGFGMTDVGRRVADNCLQELKSNFRGDLWGHNGPGAVSRVLQILCNTKLTEEMTSERCHGFTVHPPSTFYPIYYTQWNLYFEEKEKNSTMNIIKKARAIHVWNKLTSGEIITVGTQVPYAIIADEFCPKSYYSSGDFF